MNLDAAATFAQVIPALIIANYLGDIAFKNVPKLISNLLFWNIAIAVCAEFGLMMAIAFEPEVNRLATALAIFSTLTLLLMLLVLAMRRLGSFAVAKPTDSAEDQHTQQG